MSTVYSMICWKTTQTIINSLFYFPEMEFEKKCRLQNRIIFCLTQVTKEGIQTVEEIEFFS